MGKRHFENDTNPVTRSFYGINNGGITLVHMMDEPLAIEVVFESQNKCAINRLLGLIISLNNKDDIKVKSVALSV
jgi:hypothetical protein